MSKFFIFLRAQVFIPTVSLAVTALSIVSANAHQTNLDCDRAVETYQAVTEFDKEAVKKGLQICGTPAMMARAQMRVACNTVSKVRTGTDKMLSEQEPQ